jgi:hypothetical protein
VQPKLRCLFPTVQEQKLRRWLRGKGDLMSTRAGDEKTSSQTPRENVETVLDEFREALRECSGARMASGLTLVSEPSSQSLWLTGKPVLAFISESGMKRLDRDWLDRAVFSHRFRPLRGGDPLPFGSLPLALSNGIRMWRSTDC